MTKETISLMDETDPTLCAIDRAMEEKAATEEPRPYLGMSSIGESCSRKIWYRFRWMQKEYFDAQTLKRFEDGHMGEDLQAKRLRMVPGVILETHDANGNQFGYSDCNGHFRGHCDGKILGIFQAPKTWHIWEAKASGDKKINELRKIRSEIGQKQTLRKWNFVYFVQAQLYMHYEGFKRHYLTACTPGGRETESVRTEYDPVEALKAIVKANSIIVSDEPPEKLSNSPSYFECRYCSFSGICHGNEMPDRGCRSCLHSTPVENGEWHCARLNKILDKQEQMAGCVLHRYLPALVPGSIQEITEYKITYRLKDGVLWTDGEYHEIG